MASFSWPDVTAGSVRGPVSSTTNAVAKFVDASGDVLTNSGVIIDGSNNVTGVVALTTTGDVNGASPAEMAFLAGVTSAIQTQLDAMVEKAGDTMTGLLTLSGDPSTALQAATKQYVDGLIDGVKRKTHCKAASTANLTLSGEQTVDGIALVTGDRCLVKNQSTPAENGIYLVDSGSWTRTSDANTAAELNNAMVSVAQGTANADTGWYQSAEITTLGSDTVTWVQNFGAGTFVADESTLTLSGATFSIKALGITNSEVSGSAAIAYSKLDLVGSIDNDDINTSAAIAGTKIAPNFGAQTVQTTGQFTGPGAVPIGSIVAVVDDYSGASVPASGALDSYGFQLCDGAALNGSATIGTGGTLGGNTPNLSDSRFLRGSTSSGTTGGAATQTLSEANLPGHSHTIDHGHTHTIGMGFTTTAHSHGVGTIAAGWAVIAHSHGVGTIAAGFTSTAHSHSITHDHASAAGAVTFPPGATVAKLDYQNVGSGATSRGVISTVGDDISVNLPSFSGNSGPMSANLSHTHTMSGNTNAMSANLSHTHTMSGNTDAMSANLSHTHTITGGVTSLAGGLSGSGSGSGTSFSIEPKYLNVKYLIRVK